MNQSLDSQDDGVSLAAVKDALTRTNYNADEAINQLYDTQARADSSKASSASKKRVAHRLIEGADPHAGENELARDDGDFEESPAKRRKVAAPSRKSAGTNRHRR